MSLFKNLRIDENTKVRLEKALENIAEYIANTHQVSEINEDTIKKHALIVGAMFGVFEPTNNKYKKEILTAIFEALQIEVKIAVSSKFNQVNCQGADNNSFYPGL